MRSECTRCKKNIIQLEEHHLFPKFMDNPHGYSFEEYPNRVTLCFTCHKALHQKVVIPLLNQFARTLKNNGSEHHLWKQISPMDKMTSCKIIVDASYKFIFNFKEGNNGDTTKI